MGRSMSKSRPCPCTSGKPYGECCAPFHTGGREPSLGVELVRARYSAFALGEVAFLWRTLHDDHVDREKGEAQVTLVLKIASQSYKYMGLVILEAEPSRVLYLAKIFQRGREVSFVEDAEFAPDPRNGAIRYLRGRAVDRQNLGVDAATLTFERFASIR
jgi:SEC-C motif-containing protein